MSIDLDLAKRLEGNSKTAFINGFTIFLKLLNNIIDNPQEEKYRKFKKTNPRISGELLSLDGMEQLILDSGFEIDGDEFILRRGGVGMISKLKNYRDFFQKRLEMMKQSPPTLTSAVPHSSSKGAFQKATAKPKPEPIRILANKPFQERIKFPQVLKTENNFLRQIEQISDSMMQYEDNLLQESALQLIPTEKFKLNAIEKLRKIQKLIITKELTVDEPALQDLILEELAEWFKNSFFTWINTMPCKNCKNPGTDLVGTRSENGVRIERYSCKKNNCSTLTEFPRFNDIEKLLVTRSGRCGEFANCFTFLCRCLGYDARYVYCTSDHVWTEVYNHSKKRWIHIDPSENVFDSPLMYEHGWKSKLDYVLSFSKDDIQDVTWRYSNRHKEVLARRNLCKEDELISALMQLRNKRQLNESAARKKFVCLRTLSELSELMIIRDPTENELKGRSSGSLSWRLERGEQNVNNFYVFKLNDQEKLSKNFNIRYSCAKNSYERLVSTSVIDSSKDWKDWNFQSENIFRKIEHDHKIVYLSRTEGSSNGMIHFKFDFTGFTIKSIALRLETKIFESGKVHIDYLDELDRIVAKDDIYSTSKFSIKVHLSGGNGDCAWQHAQIFRQPLNDDDFPFQLSITFN